MVWSLNKIVLYSLVVQICGRTLHYCTEQLCGVLKHLFQLSVDSGHISDIWKLSVVHYCHGEKISSGENPLPCLSQRLGAVILQLHCSITHLTQYSFSTSVCSFGCMIVRPVDSTKCDTNAMLSDDLKCVRDTQCGQYTPASTGSCVHAFFLTTNHKDLSRGFTFFIVGSLDYL